MKLNLITFGKHPTVYTKRQLIGLKVQYLLSVVDPGVGTERKSVVLKTKTGALFCNTR